MPASAWSSQRHWHTHEDEFVYVLSGALVLVTDDGEDVLVKKRKGPDYEVKLVESTLKRTRIYLDKE